MADYKRGDTASWDTEQVRRGQGEQRASRPRKRRRRHFNVLTYLLFVVSRPRFWPAWDGF